MKDILDLATHFKKLAQVGLPMETPQPMPMGGQKKSMQLGEVRRALQKARLWGSKTDGPDPDKNDESFDTSGPIADKVFKIIDKYAGESFKVTAAVNVDTSMGVTISAKATSHSAEIARDLTHTFGPAMSSVLKKSEYNPPAEAITIPWFTNVGY